MSDVGAIGQKWIDWCVAEGVSPHTVKRRRSVLPRTTTRQALAAMAQTATFQ